MAQAKARILLIDDSEDLGLLIKNSMPAYHIDQVHSIKETWKTLALSRYDLFLIDLNLPDGSGFDLCLALHRNPVYTRTPKIILTGNGEVSEKVYGFSCGADDYVTKPFHTPELKARVERFFARMMRGTEPVVLHPGLELNVEFQRCTVTDGEEKHEVNLTQTEFRLLLTLLKNQGRVLTREELEQSAWQAFGTSIEKRGIDTHISHLRKKLGPLRECIASVYGQGYTFKKPA